MVSGTEATKRNNIPDQMNNKTLNYKIRTKKIKTFPQYRYISLFV